MTKKTEKKPTDDSPLTMLNDGSIKVNFATPIETSNGEKIDAITLRRPTGGDVRFSKKLCDDNGGSIEHDLDAYIAARISTEKLIPEDLDLLDAYDLIKVNEALSKLMGKPK